MNLIEWTYYREEFLLSQGFSKTFLQRFWSKVHVGPSCWLWTASVNRAGYGMIGKNGLCETIVASRASWIIRYGAIPDKTPFVLHNCPGGDNPACVNPSHLWLGTQADNVRDMVKKGRNVPPEILRGEASPNHKLKLETVLKIKNLRSEGKRPREIADLVGIPRSTVCNIFYGTCWNHTNPPPKL